MYVSALNLRNFRCFRQSLTSFIHDGAEPGFSKGAFRNLTLLVGINGSGKTTILRAVALGSLAPILSESGYRPYYLVRVPKVGARQVSKGIIVVEAALDEHETAAIAPREAADAAPDRLVNKIEITRRSDYDLLKVERLDASHYHHISRSAEVGMKKGDLSPYVYNSATDEVSGSQLHVALNEYYKDFSPSFFLLGYAANRRVEEPGRAASARAEKSRGRRYLRVAGLFEEGMTLLPLAAWFPQLKRSERQKEITLLLNRTLPSGTRFTGRFDRSRQPLFSQDGIELPFPALSDGYRSYVGVVGDMLSHLNDCCPRGRSITDLTGVVMVDDIDLHLHPQWQRVVVPRLVKAFPKLQFILTTHSPLVAGTVHAANVRVIGKHQVHQFSERLHGLSVDQILSSPYFGYTKPRTDESEKALQSLLEGVIDEGDAEPALEFLRELAGQGTSKK